MKKLFTLFFISSSFFAAKAQTVVYDVDVTGLVGMVINSGDFCFDPNEYKQQSIGNTWGFTWTSTNSNAATSVSIQFAFTIEEGSGPYPTTLNGNADAAISPAAVSCTPGPVTYSLDPTSYNPGGTNTFLMDYSSASAQSQIIKLLSICSTCYAQVTVNYSACNAPSVPTLSANPNPVCNGDSTEITIVGLLNDAATWNVYSGSCGGTLLGTTTGSTFKVLPTSNPTDYFVRGEGGCVTPGTCGTVSVNTITVDNSVTVNGLMLTANASNSTFQWYDCNLMQNISGATSQSYTATANGSYSVIVTTNGCSDTSVCTVINTVGINDHSSEKLNIYPNPVKENLFWMNPLTEAGQITITDLSGRIVLTQPLNAGTQSLSLAALPSGIYTVEIVSGANIFTEKLVKE